jgi:hypothetical protein
MQRMKAVRPAHTSKAAGMPLVVEGLVLPAGADRKALRGFVMVGSKAVTVAGYVHRSVPFLAIPMTSVVTG